MQEDMLKEGRQVRAGVVVKETADSEDVIVSKSRK